MKADSTRSALASFGEAKTCEQGRSVNELTGLLGSSQVFWGVHRSFGEAKTGFEKENQASILARSTSSSSGMASQSGVFCRRAGRPKLGQASQIREAKSSAIRKGVFCRRAGRAL